VLPSEAVCQQIHPLQIHVLHLKAQKYACPVYLLAGK